MELAGVTLAERVRLFKAALAKLETMLDAKETKFFSYMGQVGSTEEVENLALQRKAALDLVEIMGGETRGKDAGQGKPGGGTVKVVIRKFVVNVADPGLPEYAPVVVDVTPETDFIDLPPEPLPDESVVSPREDVSKEIHNGADPGDRGGKVGPSDPSPLVDDR